MDSLLALQIFYRSHSFVHYALLRLAALYLHQAGESVQFCWIPSHIAVDGNALADVAARRAVAAPCTRRFPLPVCELTAASRFVQSQWQKTWDAQQRNSLGDQAGS